MLAKIKKNLERTNTIENFINTNYNLLSKNYNIFYYKKNIKYGIFHIIFNFLEDNYIDIKNIVIEYKVFNDLNISFIIMNIIVNMNEKKHLNKRFFLLVDVLKNDDHGIFLNKMSSKFKENIELSVYENNNLYHFYYDDNSKVFKKKIL